MSEAIEREPWPLGDGLAVGRRVLREEAVALLATEQRLDETFSHAVDALLHCKGRVVVSGVGKSGHVGRKLAATLASTGTPSFFVHAAEAGHGDLGMITADDVLLVISNSGESEEVINIASFARRFGARIIGMTRSRSSSVGRLSDIHLDCSVSHEACPLGVAPTSSTTVQIALGDALAMATLATRGFTTEDFARTHPLGQLGRRYYLRVRDVMQGIRDIPHASPEARLMDVIPAMALGRMGAVLLLQGESLAGIFTDSDLRRLITQSAGHFDQKLTEPVGNVMTRNPLSIDSGQLASEALRVFEERRISRIVCVEGTKAVGLLAWHNLLHHKVA
jgi:arabinose-5-phosphate isomerase